MALQEKVMIYGVVRSYGHGVPKCTGQKQSKGKLQEGKSICTLKVVHLKGDTEAQVLLALLYYGSKPFYMMTNSYPKTEWRKKKKDVWRKY